MKELVIASYKEDLNWLGEIPKSWKITIYNTSETQVSYPQEHTFIKLPNKGREASQWAYHLVNRYNTISDFTMFLQGDKKHQTEEINKILFSNDLPDENFKYIGGFIDESFDIKNKIYIRPDSFNFLQKLWGPLSVPNAVPHIHGGQFYVRSKIIKNMPKEHYELLLDMILNNKYLIDPAYLLEPYWGCIFNRKI